MTVPPVPVEMRRVLVTGSTGSGKTTLAKALAEILGAHHVELDSYRFLSNWQNRPHEEVRAMIDADTRGERWVACGNYGKVRDLIWPRADTVILLDYPLPLVLWRLTKRSLKRAITREDLWGTGSRENFFTHLRWNDNSLYYWAIKHHNRRRREFPELLKQPAHAPLRPVHLTSPRMTQAWLQAVQHDYTNVMP